MTQNQAIVIIAILARAISEDNIPTTVSGNLGSYRVHASDSDWNQASFYLDVDSIGNVEVQNNASYYTARIGSDEVKVTGSYGSIDSAEFNQQTYRNFDVSSSYISFWGDEQYTFRAND